MLPCVYEDARYADERLRDTVVRLANGELIFVNAVPDLRRISAYKLSNFDREIVVAAGDLDISPLPLGWTLYGLNCDFLTRRPCRRYKQGTSWNNLVGARVDVMGGRSSQAYRILETPVYQRYPSWRDALSMVEDVYTKVPLTRDFAIDSEHRLWYRSQPDSVGQFNETDQRIYLTKNYLAELVEETLQHQAVVTGV